MALCGEDDCQEQRFYGGTEEHCGTTRIAGRLRFGSCGFWRD